MRLKFVVLCLAAVLAGQSTGAMRPLDCPRICYAQQADYPGGINVGPQGTSLTISFGPRH